MRLEGRPGPRLPSSPAGGLLQLLRRPASRSARTRSTRPGRVTIRRSPRWRPDSEFSACIALLTQLQREAAAHPAARQASRILAALGELASLPAAAGLRAPPTTSAARAEAVFSQTLHGLALGVEACELLDCSGPRAWSAATVFGAGSGLGASLLLTQRGVTGGQARALSSGVLWGAWNALALGSATEAFAKAEDAAKAYSLALMLGQLTGLGGGLIAHELFRPEAGDVSLTSSGGIWSAVLTFLTLGLLDVDPSRPSSWSAMLIASDRGLVAGSLLASHEPHSVGRVLMVDAGGIVGLVVGFGADLIIEGDDPTQELLFGSAIVGTLTGLALTYWLTEGWGDRAQTLPQLRSRCGRHPRAPCSPPVAPSN